MHTISFHQSREVDRIAIERYGMNGLVLMENAGRGVATRLAARFPQKHFLILCGKGNNGGDGFVIARHLQILDANVTMITTSPMESLSHDAGVNARIAELADIPMVAFDTLSNDDVKQLCSDADVIIDCLLGTGVTGNVREPARSLIQAANASSAIRIAVDIPSGWPIHDGDGLAFRADHTFTFVAPKHGMETNAESPWLGSVEVIGIGVPQKLLDDLLKTR